MRWWSAVWCFFRGSAMETAVRTNDRGPAEQQRQLRPIERGSATRDVLLRLALVAWRGAWASGSAGSRFASGASVEMATTTELCCVAATDELWLAWPSHRCRLRASSGGDNSRGIDNGHLDSGVFSHRHLALYAPGIPTAIAREDPGSRSRTVVRQALTTKRRSSTSQWQRSP